MIYRLGQRRRRLTARVCLVWGMAGCVLGVGVAGAFGAAASPGTADGGYVQSQRRAEVQSYVMDTRQPAQQGPQTSKTKTSKVDVQGSGARGCDNAAPPHAGLGASSVPQLRKLAEYEQVCGSAVAASVSFFVGTPRTAAEGASEAVWVADRLKEFARYGIAPLVFMEPTTSDGLVDAVQYRTGHYDAALDAYFAALKAAGITDAMMGTWVPWPEGNIPVWTSVDPGDFVANVTKTVQFQKRYFPTSRAAVLLESKTYPSARSWSGGAYVSLLPYVRGIPAGLIDSLGLQGFAWPPTAPNEAPMLDPIAFLRVDLAAEAARSLGVKQIWLNTGVFAKSFVVQRAHPYTLNPERRQAVLKGVSSQASALRSQGFEPVIHLFAEDKGASGEGIDWSYWPAGQMSTSSATDVFKRFAGDLQAAGIPLWLYDAASE